MVPRYLSISLAHNNVSRRKSMGVTLTSSAPKYIGTVKKPVMPMSWKHGSQLTPLHAELVDADTGAGLASVTVAPGREGFVSAEAPGGARRLRLRVQSDNAHEREACVVLRALEPEQAAAR